MDRQSDLPIRAWVTGCSSGEEAYTLAILLIEAGDAAGKTPGLNIFATNPGLRSLADAREGLYPKSIESALSPERLARFFDNSDSGYRIKAFVRELVFFAPQNLLPDAPFSRLDLCICRNLLTGLSTDTQRRVLKVIHSALRPGGALFLNESETTKGAEDLFEVISKTHRVFRRAEQAFSSSAELMNTNPRLIGFPSTHAQLSYYPVTSSSESESGANSSSRSFEYELQSLRAQLNCTIRELQGDRQDTTTLRGELKNNDEDLHRLILDSLKEDAIFMLDATGRIVTWNPAAERILGYGPNDVIGRPLSILSPLAADESGHEPAQLETARAQGIAKEEGWRVRKDGSRFWESSSLSRLLDKSGRIRGFVKALRDDTQRHVSEEALRQAKREAELANVAKDQFLAIVSHELRTPISAIVLWASLLDDQNNIDPRQLSEALTAIKNGAEEQRNLIEDLVDMSRIVNGKLRLEKKAVQIAEVVKAGADSVRTFAMNKTVELIENVDPQAGRVEADGGRLKQVVSNLLSNAVKFTPPHGKITIGVCRLGHDIIISVKDTGRGLAPEFLPKVFERFSQADDGTTRASNGLGLGLAIAKQIVELHGGNIAVESRGLGLGSTFTVRLPLPLVQDQTAPDPPPLPTKSRLSHQLAGNEILLVEDAASTRQALIAVLQEAGAHVVAVDAAAAACAAFEQRRPDVVLSDLGLPTINGYTLIRNLREIETRTNSRPVPVVALTAFAGDTIREKAVEHGFQECLIKPIEPVFLVEKLSRLIESFRTG